jgi:molybdopterin-guanine dinucleotide biosynthesis protein A
MSFLVPPRMDPGSPALPRQAITGLILAGGLSRRMNPPLTAQPIDKGLMLLAGRPLGAWVIDRLQAQVVDILISTNHPTDDWSRLGYRLVADRRAGFPGPLAGLEAGLHVALRGAQTGWVMTVPCDGPFFPRDLALHLSRHALLNAVPIAIARSAARLHPVYMLVRGDMLANLSAFLDSGGRSVQGWISALPHVEVLCGDETDFANLNTPDDLDRAQFRQAELGAGARAVSPCP